MKFKHGKYERGGKEIELLSNPSFLSTGRRMILFSILQDWHIKEEEGGSGMVWREVETERA